MLWCPRKWLDLGDVSPWPLTSRCFLTFAYDNCLQFDLSESCATCILHDNVTQFDSIYKSNNSEHIWRSPLTVTVWQLFGAAWQSSADLDFTAILLFSFVTYPPSSQNRTQPKPATRSKVNAIWKRMSESWGIPFPYKSGAKNHLFSTTSQLNGNFNGLYLRNETQ